MELNASVLRILLTALIDANRAYLRTAARMGIRIPHLYESGVRYGRAPWDSSGRNDTWDSIPDLYMKGYGDCKSLTAAYVAQARERGYDVEPAFRYSYRTLEPFMVEDWKRKLQLVKDKFGVKSKEYASFARKNDGGLDYHILVAADGTMPSGWMQGSTGDLWVDPSKVLGMGRQENQ